MTYKTTAASAVTIVRNIMTEFNSGVENKCGFFFSIIVVSSMYPRICSSLTVFAVPGKQHFLITCNLLLRLYIINNPYRHQSFCQICF